ncbi:MAG: transcription termination/antitermination protein NusG [Candidatus Marinimicrobia bacterium]|nr:transcription termination/antitermination protein NusG [Candidatus Neomarinimicrobiota bacterium]
MNWYSLRVYSGKEGEVETRIQYEAEKNKLSDYIEEVLVPKEKVVEMKNGKKKTKEKVFYPGYIMVKIELTPQTQYFFENLSGVISFVGSKGTPQKLTESEVHRILGEVQKKDGQETFETRFEIGDPVKIVDGPFIDFDGVIEDTNEEKQKLKVMVSIFGRSTPVELNYLQVEIVK